MSESSSKSEIDRVYELGADHYLVKTSNLDELNKAVRSLESKWFVGLNYQS
ncbi:MAG TPA: hypothetical protein VK791_05880 [bacterium]|nr:hypothetical protein [bacterium]